MFKVVLLDAKNTVLKETTVSEGSLTLSIVHPREVFAFAVKESAAAVIFLAQPSQWRSYAEPGRSGPDGAIGGGGEVAGHSGP